MKEQPTIYQSEHVIVEAPFSFTGATKRLWPLTRSNDPYLRNFVLIPGVIVLLSVCYTGILMWYAIFGIFLIPFRLIRRSQRHKKQRELQHREMIEAISKQRAH